MRIGRISTADGPRYVAVEGDRGVLLRGSIAEGFTPDGESTSLPDAFLPPVLPSKVVAVASNYPKHNQEMGRSSPGEPRLFLKPPTAVIGHGGR